jgi:hypothetical protein
LYSRFDLFPENLGEASDQQGERFDQDIKSTEHRSRFLGRLHDKMCVKNRHYIAILRERS